jgi:CheY-like chemotaxis protein
MSDDLVSVRLLTVSGSNPARDLWRQGAALLAVPVDVMEAESAIRARSLLAAKEIDIALLDVAIAGADRTALLAAARAAKPPPLVVLVAATKTEAVEFAAGGDAVDAVVVKPAAADQAKVLIERCNRLRQPSRVLVVDDSATMRTIVRKVLAASRFRLDIAEAPEGFEALKQIASGLFDAVFLDHNMPGLNGVETLSEIKRQFPHLKVVIMTSAQTEAVAERARAAGAAAFLKKPFYPADIDAVLHSIFGLHGGR